MQTFNTTGQYIIAAASRTDAYMAAASGGTTVGTNLILVNQTSALKFTIIRSTKDATKWNICTSATVGDNYCVNQWGNNVTQGALITAGYWSGSELTLAGTDQSDGSTFWTIQSTFGGPDKYLAAVGNNVVMIGNATVGTTYWRMTDTTQFKSSNASSTSIGANSTSSSTTSNDTPSKSPLAIGVGVGVALGVILIGAIIAFFCIRRRRKARRANAAHTMPPPMQEQLSPAPMYTDPAKRKPVPSMQAVEAPGSTPGTVPYKAEHRFSEMDASYPRPVYELDSARTS